METSLLVKAMDDLLQPFRFVDYAPNGLQVEGSSQVKHLVTGVSASQALIDQAVAQNADMLLVHHGFFWQNEDPRIIDMKYRRLRAILNNNINLVSYHLPLDAHLEYGNNAQLAKRLNLKIEGVHDNTYVFYGSLQQQTTAQSFANKIEQALARKPLLIQGNNRPIQKVVWCSGAGQKYITEAANFGADCFLSGEISETTTHLARELEINYFACGHHATERYGVKALGEYLANKFKIKHSFIDIDNPA